MVDTSSLLRHQLKPSTLLRFPDFERQFTFTPNYEAYTFKSLDSRDWYRNMVHRISIAIRDKQFLPIYRMADGEFIFGLGKRASDTFPVCRLSRGQLLRRIWSKVTGETFTHRSGSAEYGWESYNKAELLILREKYIKQLSWIARKGILAIALHTSPGFRPYFPLVPDWLDEHEIPLTYDNYYHFYSVYALLHGSDRRLLYEDRNVLVVTGLTDTKREGIRQGLIREGARKIQFLPISQTNSMNDTLDLSSIALPVDVVLVGAGIGSINILNQLESVQTACIDAGFGLSTLADPELRWHRPFCVPDDEFDLSKIKWHK